MVYADSYIDYTWEITTIDPIHRFVTVQFNPADSTDSSRSTIFKNVRPMTDDFASGNAIRAMVKRLEQDVVDQWANEVNSRNEYASFDADSWYGSVNSDRYKPYNTNPSNFVDKFNPLKFRDSYHDSEGEYEIQTVQTIIPLDSNGVESARNHVTATPAAIRLQLDYLGRLDSAEAIAATMSDKARTMWEYAEDFLSGDSTGATLREGLGFGDSAWAQMILDADSNFGQFDVEQAQ